MSIALDSPIRAEDRSAATGTVFTTRVLRDMAAAEPVWRRLETEAVLTSYQRYDWIKQVLLSRDAPTTIAIVVIEDAGSPVALLPLEIESRMGIRIAQIVGSEIGNIDWMIVAPRAAPLMTRERVLAALREASAAVGGIDLVTLHGQPVAWRGVTNPLLAFPHQPGPEHLYFSGLEGSESFSRYDEKRLASLHRRTRKLANAYGPVALHEARTIEEIDRFHEAFLEQRGTRFRQMGIANIFAEPHFVKLFREGAIASLGQKNPALVFHAMTAGDQIIAAALGSYGDAHYTQYINSNATGDVAKYRLITIFLHALFTEVKNKGATSIDMGLGDFDYKKDWTSPETVYDGVIPLSLRGRMAGTAILAKRRLKRAIKQHDGLWSLVRKLRARLARSAPQPSQDD